MSNICIVCRRIPANHVLKHAHQVFYTKYSQEERRKIGLEAIRLINAIDKNNRLFFCGKSERAILAGLFYIMGLIREKMNPFIPIDEQPYNTRNWVTQLEMARYFKSTDVTVRNSFRRWITFLRDAKVTWVIDHVNWGGNTE